MTHRAAMAVLLWLSLAACQGPMVLIPAGPFLMGSPEGGDSLSDEHPQRTVTLRAFWMDRYEVTNADYARFVAATGHPAPKNASPAVTLWEQDRPLAGSGQHPVVNIGWQDAAAYCRWANKRLPTEAEWEKAARGTDGRLYPWGNEWDWTRANSASYWAGRTVEFKDGAEWKDFWVNGEGARISKERGLKREVLTLPVGRFPEGASPYGLLDMAGNASEWVQDWYEPYYYLKAPPADPKGPDGILLKVARGGSWLKPAKSLRTADRDYGFPDDPPSGTGFRCAQ
ncbi:MAG: formylglycine-generating enzyme family protein, partial [Nitrospirota bacterium]|nr:formylglycine-generating enzyme family protein [Nitrospirota bacterium]